jgi:hypothetical protein
MDERSRALHYYLANQNEINRDHLGDFVAISNNKVLGYYKTDWDGIQDMVKRGVDLKSVNVSKCFPEGDAAYHVNWWVGR